MQRPWFKEWGLDLPPRGVAGMAGRAAHRGVLCPGFCGSGPAFPLGERYALWNFSLCRPGPRNPRLGRLQDVKDWRALTATCYSVDFN